jgi:hypothetical protein
MGKSGLPSQIAQAVTSFLTGKLLAGRLGRAGGPALEAQARGPAGQAATDLNHLLERMSRGQSVDASFLRSSGMADQSSQQAGLDPETASASLGEAISLVGNQLGSRQ